MAKKYKKIGCVADFGSELASDAFAELMKKYKLLDASTLPVNACDAIIALGGDGMMLRVVHKYMQAKVPVFGMNRGSIGFLLNPYNEENLIERVQQSVATTLYPLEMKAKTTDGEIKTALAINEVSLLREINQAAKIKITVDGAERLDCLICDGILVSTPAGSTAYNFAANGPIIPLDANTLALTPISPFRPRRWRGALLSHNNKVRFDILSPERRPVSAVADFTEVRNVTYVEVEERKDKPFTVLFDKGSNIEERIIKEQFMP